MEGLETIIWGNEIFILEPLFWVEGPLFWGEGLILGGRPCVS
jgi:hypothetical protein